MISFALTSLKLDVASRIDMRAKRRGRGEQFYRDEVFAGQLKRFCSASSSSMIWQNMQHPKSSKCCIAS
jgi:hypothetical protein